MQGNWFDAAHVEDDNQSLSHRDEKNVSRRVKGHALRFEVGVLDLIYFLLAVADDESLVVRKRVDELSRLLSGGRAPNLADNFDQFGKLLVCLNYRLSTHVEF